MEIKVLRNILEANDALAADNHRLLSSHGVAALNLMSSPGAGKTTLLERTLDALKGEMAMAVIEGDIATRYDADRIGRHSVPVLQINTGGGCHLDANMVRRALDELPVAELNLLFIENVGNLVCPAIYDLGQAANVVVLSVTEGEDKPLKYPVMFKAVDLVLIAKCDLVPHLEVDLTRIHDALSRVMPSPRAIEISARTGQGIAEWLAWLEEQRQPFAVG